ncbi:MAG: hypothetical protein GY754_45815, partial [bacterium]|nr:hypothetical protein [bacterium]
FIKTKWDYSGGTTPWGNLNEVMTYTCNENGLITEIVEDSVSGSDSFTALSYNESGLLSTFARYAGLDSSGTFGGKYVVEYNSDKFMTLVFFISSDTNYCYEFVYDGDTLSGQNTYEASTPADDKLGAAVNYTWEETD